MIEYFVIGMISAALLVWLGACVRMFTLDSMKNAHSASHPLMEGFSQGLLMFLSTPLWLPCVGVYFGVKYLHSKNPFKEFRATFQRRYKQVLFISEPKRSEQKRLI